MNSAGEQQVALYLSSLGDRWCLAKAAFEQIDWAAWMKFIAGAAVHESQDDLADVNG